MSKQDRITDSDREILTAIVQAVLDTSPEHRKMPLRDLGLGPGRQDQHPDRGGASTG
jgi:hypothetical protein